MTLEPLNRTHRLLLLWLLLTPSLLIESASTHQMPEDLPLVECMYTIKAHINTCYVKLALNVKFKFYMSHTHFTPIIIICII